MRTAVRVVAASLLAVLGCTSAAADPAVGARVLTEQVADLTQQVAALQASNESLRQNVETLSGHVSALLASSAALGSTLACVAPESGAGRLVLRGCDLAVERTNDGSGTYGNVEIEGVLSVNEVDARIEEGDPLSGDLRIRGEESVLLQSGSGSHLVRRNGTVQMDGDNVSVRSSGDVRIAADARIILQAAEILEN